MEAISEVNVPQNPNPPEIPINPGVDDALGHWQYISQNSEADIHKSEVAAALEKSPIFQAIAHGYLISDPRGKLDVLASLCSEIYLAGVLAKVLDIAPVIHPCDEG